MILLAPDSYKGSLDAAEVARAMADGLRRAGVASPVRLLPMADGGEGTLAAILGATGAQRRAAAVTGACGEPVTAAWGLLPSAEGPAAVIEVAQVVGITMDLKRPVRERTTRGLGELIRHCLDLGVRRFMIGLGGSSTNDGGAGLLAALGARLLDRDGAPVAPGPAGLEALRRVDVSGLDARLRESALVAMSDVANPLCGPLGATAVFGAQKGVTPAEAALFDGWIARYAALCDEAFGRASAELPGAGAAGGLGYALLALGASCRSGADVVMDLLGFDALLPQAEWILTGEGRSDAQTLLGKVPDAVARRAAAHGVPVTLVSGSVDAASLGALAPRFAGCFSILDRCMTLDEAVAEAGRLVGGCVEQIARLRLACRPAS